MELEVQGKGRETEKTSEPHQMHQMESSELLKKALTHVPILRQVEYDALDSGREDSN